MFKKTIVPEELEKMEIASFPGTICVIDSLGPDFDKAIRYLRSQKIIGFDTETRPCFSPSQPRYGVALLQLSGPEKAYLFRVQKTGMHRRLCNILADEAILKIGAAVVDDIRGLQKYASFEPGGFVDLQKIVWEWGIKDKSVKKMSAIILGTRVSKTQQLSNWEADNLSDGQKRYAATDAWVCREMYLELMKTEKNPLSPEELLPPMTPEQKAKIEAKAKAKAEREAAMEEARRRKAARKAANIAAHKARKANKAESAEANKRAAKRRRYRENLKARKLAERSNLVEKSQQTEMSQQIQPQINENIKD